MLSEEDKLNVEIRTILESDIPGIIGLCGRVYPGSQAWSIEQLESQIKTFPEGQLVMLHPESGEVLAYAAGLIVSWDDYNSADPWRDFTAHGMFTNHNPQSGRTLYGAEVMVDLALQGRGLGTKIYEARRDLCRALSLLRIRAGARLRNYHLHAPKIAAGDYVAAVVRGEIYDATLSFQLKQGFQVLDVVQGYLRDDPESLGYAALIEWINVDVAEPRHIEAQRQSPYFIESFSVEKF